MFVVPHTIEEPTNQLSIKQTQQQKPDSLFWKSVVRTLECIRLSWDIDVSFVVSQIKKKTKRINDRMSKRMDPSMQHQMSMKNITNLPILEFLC